MHLPGITSSSAIYVALGSYTLEMTPQRFTLKPSPALVMSSHSYLLSGTPPYQRDLSKGTLKDPCCNTDETFNAIPLTLNPMP